MILTRTTRLNQPRGPVEVDRQNLLADGVEFAYIPGFSRDLNGKYGSIQSVGPSTSFLNGTMVTPGTVRNNGLILASGALLGPLQNSTVLAIVNTRAGLVAGTTGIESDGLIGSGGNTIYSERAPTGNDIYKISLVALTGPTLNAEFTYRNDGATLLQQRAVINGYNDGRQLAVAAVKNGTSHSVYCESISSTGTFGSASSAFTNASIQRRIGSDIADANGAWNGQILLVVGWSRALSASEIAEVKDNPWQLFRPVQRRIYFDMGAGGGATTQVSNDLTGDYAIRSAVQSDSSGSYSVRAAVQADASSTYTVLGAVSADAAAEYNILTSAQADLDASFTVRGSVQVDGMSAFTVRGSTQADAPATYLLRGNVSSDIGGTYDILNANSVSSSLAASYVVRGAVQSDVSGSYDLRTSVGAASEHAFMVRGLVSSDLAASYEVQAAAIPVYADLAGSYAVDGIAPDFTRSIYWAAVPAEKFSAAVTTKKFKASVPSEKFSAAVPGGNQ